MNPSEDNRPRRTWKANLTWFLGGVLLGLVVIPVLANPDCPHCGEELFGPERELLREPPEPLH